VVRYLWWWEGRGAAARCVVPSCRGRCCSHRAKVALPAWHMWHHAPKLRQPVCETGKKQRPRQQKEMAAAGMQQRARLSTTPAPVQSASICCRLPRIQHDCRLSSLAAYHNARIGLQPELPHRRLFTGRWEPPAQGLKAEACIGSSTGQRQCRCEG
jgi:hypothetical protein